MKKYVLHCPNAVNTSKHQISTIWEYDTKADAVKHKKLCDAWDELNGNKPTTFIEEIDV